MSPVDSYTAAHLDRVSRLMHPTAADTNLDAWIVANTTIAGRPWTFEHHEFQQFILSLDAPILYIKKSSQLGVSELIARYLLAYLMLNQGTSAVYIMPTSGFAKTFSQTRITPIIEGSQVLSMSVDKNIDSLAIKRLGSSFLYFQGASKTSQAISIPLSMLVADELNFMENASIVTSFASRLTHAENPIERYFSTPTLPGRGVSYGFDRSKRYIILQKCQRCNHRFVPSYYEHVVLPGFSGPLTEINYFTRDILEKYDVDAAYLSCPKCRRPIDQSILKNRPFVCENPDSRSDSVGVHLTPFSAPKFMPPSRLIRTSTKYQRVADFVNFALGEDYDDRSAGMAATELEQLFYSDVRYPDYPPYQIAGTDVGGQCAHLTAYPAPDGHIRVMHAELIPLHALDTVYPQLLAKYNVISSVMDALPQTATVKSLQSLCPQMWAAIRAGSKTTSMFQIKEVEEDEGKALYGVRQVSFVRHLLFDLMIEMLRSKKISFAPATHHLKDVIISHLTDMKREKVFDGDGEEIVVWRKSLTGQDHFFHALAYLLLANFLKGTAQVVPSLPFLLKKVKTNGNF